ncbi:MAG TPA: hypothetical protein VH475_23930 [Tepidisphaeraceae bacterium]|jgi:hypothetical protein
MSAAEPRALPAVREPIAVIHGALDDLAAAIEGVVSVISAEVALAPMGLERAGTARDATDGLLRLPLPEPGYAVLYGQEKPGVFFLLLEEPNGQRLPLPW